MSVNICLLGLLRPTDIISEAYLQAISKYKLLECELRSKTRITGKRAWSTNSCNCLMLLRSLSNVYKVKKVFVIK